MEQSNRLSEDRIVEVEALQKTIPLIEDRFDEMRRWWDSEATEVVWTKLTSLVYPIPEATMAQRGKLPRVMKKPPKILQHVTKNLMIDGQFRAYRRYQELDRVTMEGYIPFEDRVLRATFLVSRSGEASFSTVVEWFFDEKGEIRWSCSLGFVPGRTDIAEYLRGPHGRVERVRISMYGKDYLYGRGGTWRLVYDNDGKLVGRKDDNEQ